jgi:membrane-associated phospholipid phosphatase
MIGRKRTASIISDLTVPPVLAVPFYTVICLIDQAQNGGGGPELLARLFFSITFDVTLPTCFVLYLYAKKRVTDLHISVREQRHIPYLFNIITDLIGFLFILWLLGTGVLAAIMLINVINRMLVSLINLWWKISGHAIGVTTPLAGLFWFFGGWAILPLFLLVPLVGWARVYLHAHTLAQVIAGSFFGFLATLLQLGFIFHPLGWL